MAHERVADHLASLDVDNDVQIWHNDGLALYKGSDKDIEVLAQHYGVPYVDVDDARNGVESSIWSDYYAFESLKEELEVEHERVGIAIRLLPRRLHSSRHLPSYMVGMGALQVRIKVKTLDHSRAVKMPKTNSEESAEVEA